MNLNHLKTIAWLRWRLMFNQLKRSGKAQRKFTIVILVLASIGSFGLFFATWFGGSLFLNDAPSSAIFLMWTGIAGFFLFVWGIGVITDLQRSEPLELSKFLHLPMSPLGAFLTNFISSFISISMFLIFPIMLGSSFAMIRRFGWTMLPILLLLFAFLLMVMAVTYQFRGWLAGMMINKRRRRTIITALTLLVVLISQAPLLMNMTVFSELEKASKIQRDRTRQLKNVLTRKLENKEITQAAYQVALDDMATAKQEREVRQANLLADRVRPGCYVFPPGWFPLAVEKLTHKNFFWPAICFLGLTGVTVLSLRRSYATTLRMYRGEVSTPIQSNTATDTVSDLPFKPDWQYRIVQRKFPFLNEQQSTIAASTFVGMLRAPEAKLALLTPFLMMALLAGTFLWKDNSSLPEQYLPFTAIGVATFAMFGIMQILNNQFGFDRDGFRCLVLSPVPRRDILIGKNMAFFPFAIVFGSIGIITLQIVAPLKFTHFIATFIQLGTIYLVTCMVANLMSIKAPLAVASGTMRPANLKVGIIVLQLLITILLPIGLLPTMIPPSVELLVHGVFGFQHVPIYLILSLILFFIAVVVYRMVIKKQAALLVAEEKDLLNVITGV